VLGKWLDAHYHQHVAVSLLAKGSVLMISSNVICLHLLHKFTVHHPNNLTTKAYLLGTPR